ncbi:hypothetical protein PR048_008944 [Dryococelus australis]|uniref:Uncharacterized protein n=1 Tax=Dryococelus australis TaxID=614101 RepID=A0ABQ9HYI8_9NEOP|nr:hypothetical protein PR048_008944 [Dryococelus australis]
MTVAMRMGRLCHIHAEAQDQVLKRVQTRSDTIYHASDNSARIRFCSVFRPLFMLATSVLVHTIVETLATLHMSALAVIESTGTMRGENLLSLESHSANVAPRHTDNHRRLELETRFRAAIETIKNTPTIFNDVFRNMLQRCRACIECGGTNSEQLLYSLLGRLPASHLRRTGFKTRRIAPGFSHVGIVPDDAAGRRVFSVISGFPRRFIPALIHTHLASTSSALQTCLLTLTREPDYLSVFGMVHCTSTGHKAYSLLAALATQVLEAAEPRTAYYNLEMKRDILLGNTSWTKWEFLPETLERAPLLEKSTQRLTTSGLDRLERLQIADGRLKELPPATTTFTRTIKPPASDRRFSHVGIVPDDAPGRWVFPAVSHFLPHFHSGAPPYSPLFILIGCEDLDVKSHQNIFTHFTHSNSVCVLLVEMHYNVLLTCALYPVFLYGLHELAYTRSRPSSRGHIACETSLSLRTKPAMNKLENFRHPDVNMCKSLALCERSGIGCYIYPVISGIVKHDSQVRKSGSDPARNRTRLVWQEDTQLREM